MSISIEVELNTGAKMGYENNHTAGNAERALSELDRGYKMIRQWLFDQLSPAEQAKFRGSPAEQDSRPRPEERTREIVRETIQDDAKRAGRWHR